MPAEETDEEIKDCFIDILKFRKIDWVRTDTILKFQFPLSIKNLDFSCEGLRAFKKQILNGEIKL